MSNEIKNVHHKCIRQRSFPRYPLSRFDVSLLHVRQIDTIRLIYHYSQVPNKQRGENNRVRRSEMALYNDNQEIETIWRGVFAKIEN